MDESGSATRREFVSGLAGMAALTMLPVGSEAQDKLSNDPMRPQFHLLPARNWMNDPNGPVYHAGAYHMFFQYNPHAAVWGDMSWYHSTSPDMLHWKHLPLAFAPTPGSVDAYGCFSGSAITVGKRVYVVYTATQLGTAEKATLRDGGPKQIQETQCLAWSDDARLIRWTKQPEPVVTEPPPGMKITGFRDPSAWKQGDWFYMTVGAGEANVGGCVLLYRSRDLQQWEYLHKLASGVWNGKKTANPCDDGEMWECPELFALDGRHVLIYSTLGQVVWRSGRLDPQTMLFHAEQSGLLDMDSFYAPKTQLDARGRRILWGWIQERRTDAAMVVAGWSGMMSLPRVLSLDAGGVLRMGILPETRSLRGPVLGVHKGTAVIPKATGEVLCTGADGDFSVQFTAVGGADLLRIAYLASSHSFDVAGKVFALQAGDRPSVHAFVDGSVLEVMLGDRIGCTRRFYYDGQVAPGVSVLITGQGVRLEGWAVRPISGDRLTTEG